jgi:uncharacterized protein (TIGR02145 family)
MYRLINILFSILLGGIFLSQEITAQSPQKMSYQAVIRNNQNHLVTNQQVGMQISILQGSPTGTAVYTETLTPATNANGLITIEIGGGSGFSSIIWSSGPYFLKTEIDPEGGTNYTITGTSQLLSVPYALYSKYAGSYNETDPVFAASPLSIISGSDINNWNTAYGWGSHTGLYRPLLWVPSWSDVTGKPVLSKVAISGSYNDLSDVPSLPDATWANLTGKPFTIAGFGITDAMSTSHIANGITTGMINDWNTSYSWGNHAGLYRPLSWIPSWSDVTGKPVLSTVAISGSYNDLSDIPSLFDGTWTNLTGKPATIAGYGITDAMSTSHVANGITSGIINDWNTSYSWGNHAGLYRPVSWVPSWSDITGKPVLSTVAISGSYNDLTDIPLLFDGTWTSLTSKPATIAGYGITDAMSTSHVANGITSGLISNWNTAYSWGNHSTAGYVAGTRTLTINGTAFDLTSNRSWSVGTVTSIALSLPAIFSVTGSPVTVTGALSASLVSQSAGLVFASPSGSAGTPSFRSLVSTDIPNLDWSKITSGKPTTLAGYGITDGVNTTGNQSIAGNKTFTGSVIVPTPAYANEAVTKAYVDALLTQIQQLQNQPGILKDYEGNLYTTLRIGNQVWMGENLKTTRYRNGDPIPLVSDPTTWSTTTTPAYCWYNNNEAANKNVYGAMYNWYAVNTGMLCPAGWHVPSDADWLALTNYLGGDEIAGGKLKEAGTVHWTTPNTEASNESGFTALPGGYRNKYGTFSGFGGFCYWWCSNEYDPTLAFYRMLYYTSSFVLRTGNNKLDAFYVRCVRD